MFTVLGFVHRDLNWADTAQGCDTGVLMEGGDKLCRGCLSPLGLSSSQQETRELSNAEQGGSILPEKWQRCRENGTGRFLHKG